MGDKNTFDAFSTPLSHIRFQPTHEYDIKILCAPEMLRVKLRAFTEGVVIYKTSPTYSEEFHPWHQVVRVTNGRRADPELPPVVTDSVTDHVGVQLKEKLPPTFMGAELKQPPGIE